MGQKIRKTFVKQPYPAVFLFNVIQRPLLETPGYLVWYPETLNIKLTDIFNFSRLEPKTNTTKKTKTKKQNDHDTK